VLGLTLWWEVVRGDVEGLMGDWLADLSLDYMLNHTHTIIYLREAPRCENRTKPEKRSITRMFQIKHTETGPSFLFYENLGTLQDPKMVSLADLIIKCKQQNILYMTLVNIIATHMQERTL
jgi:hypothetical protein